MLAETWSRLARFPRAHIFVLGLPLVYVRVVPRR